MTVLKNQGPKVQGHCPVCGGAELFLGQGGYVTCAVLECPRPEAVSDLLDDREIEHIIQINEDTYTVRHPLRERLGDALMECRVADFVTPQDGLGMYRVKPSQSDESEWDWTWEKIS